MAQVLHLPGPVLVSADDLCPEAWVLGGRMTYTRPAGDHDVTTVAGWVLPGLVDAHCHVGLDRYGAVDDATAEAQATTDRDAGTLLIRDAGSPADTRWIDGRADLPRVIRAGRHIARTRRYLRNYAWEVEPDQLVERVRIEARAGDGWVKLVGDWIDRDLGDLAPCWPRDVLAEAVAAAHEEGARVTAHCFGEESLRDLAAAGTDCVEHACGLEDDTVEAFAAQGIAIVPTLVNIDTFPQIAEPA
ncbi:MAG: amidohydrolase family protein, partial [Dermatophilaceae bacterium]